MLWRRHIMSEQGAPPNGERQETQHLDDVAYEIAETIEPGVPKYIVDFGDSFEYPTIERSTEDDLQIFYEACEATVQAVNDPDFWRRVEEAAELEESEPGVREEAVDELGLVASGIRRFHRLRHGRE